MYSRYRPDADVRSLPPQYRGERFSAPEERPSPAKQPPPPIVSAPVKVPVKIAKNASPSGGYEEKPEPDPTEKAEPGPTVASPAGLHDVLSGLSGEELLLTGLILLLAESEGNGEIVALLTLLLIYRPEEAEKEVT